MGNSCDNCRGLDHYCYRHALPLGWFVPWIPNQLTYWRWQVNQSDKLKSFVPDYLSFQTLTDAKSSWYKKFIGELDLGSSHTPQCWLPMLVLMSHELPVYLLLPAVSAFSLPEQSQKHMLLQTLLQRV
ncbi:hypothetical protein XELAEV_18029100mg [Xenopus laevis]|uniref:Uncharacterized protein n=1 Tax=Xenopus laevis TaxID=8355 RepID=A0A974HHG2_XENLA|nr:hypothetical protein XELAEV_18029100mg [Xenopus laevis]